jgi:hypothetical protein
MTLCRKHFAEDDAVIVAVKKRILEADRNFYERGDVGFGSVVVNMWKNKCKYLKT